MPSALGVSSGGVAFSPHKVLRCRWEGGPHLSPGEWLVPTLSCMCAGPGWLPRILYAGLCPHRGRSSEKADTRVWQTTAFPPCAVQHSTSCQLDWVPLVVQAACDCCYQLRVVEGAMTVDSKLMGKSGGRRRASEVRREPSFPAAAGNPS